MQNTQSNLLCVRKNQKV